MLSILPQIALVLCIIIFIIISIKVLFFTSKKEIKDMSELPLDDDVK
jgi:hypothetical protein